MKQHRILPQFVEFIPDHLEEGVLYISERYRTCSHKCCCGCGEEVVTPLSPAEWRLSREGDFVSLWPSVGNGSYACRSHYVIRRNEVHWADVMTAKQVARAQQRDSAALNRFVARSNAKKAGGEPRTGVKAPATRPPEAATPAPDVSPRTGPRSGKRKGLFRQLRDAIFGDDNESR